MTEIGRPNTVEVDKLVLSGEVARLREFFAEEGDAIAYNDALELRKKVEPLEGWDEIKKLAVKELESLPADIFDKLFKRFEPFIAVLPSGHGRGHVLRDAINAVLIANDPEIAKADPVEVFVGMVGGTFHDVGNSIVYRYDEAYRLASHAEVGAYLINVIAKDMIPPNLLTLVRYAIAAHTHYIGDQAITKGEKVYFKKPYQDDIVNGSRLGVWTTQWADRLEANGPMHIIRHIITKYEPTMDFTAGEFDPIWESPEEDFKHQFTPILRSTEVRKSSPTPLSSARVLEHVTAFADSNYNPDLPYAKYDTAYYRWQLITPLVSWARNFVLAVAAEAPSFSEKETSQLFENFYALCKKVEPGQEIDAAMNIMREKFKLLSEDERRHWANGFRTLDDQYRSWYGRMDGLLSQKIQAEDPKLRELIANLKKVGIQSLFNFMPTEDKIG